MGGGEHQCERETLVSYLPYAPQLGIEPATVYALTKD